MLKKSEIKILELLYDNVDEPINKKSMALQIGLTEKTIFESINSLLDKKLVYITDAKGRGKFYLLSEKGVLVAELSIKILELLNS